MGVAVNHGQATLHTAGSQATAPDIGTAGAGSGAGHSHVLLGQQVGSEAPLTFLDVRLMGHENTGSFNGHLLGALGFHTFSAANST